MNINKILQSFLSRLFKKKEFIESFPVNDMFEPNTEPAKTIYNVFKEASKNRKDKDFKIWILEERMAVYNASVKWAKENNLNIPTFKDIEKAENEALGYCDYGSKWAYGISDIINKEKWNK